MQIPFKTFALFLLLISTTLNAQYTVNDYVNQGITYHDDGEYDKAIETYKKALALEPYSALACYEIALTYFTKGDHEEAITYADRILKKKGDYMIPAYLIKGSALDVMGRTKESIKLFEKAIKKETENYLLYYNLALNYFNINQLDDAEKWVIKAIETNSKHPTSHLLLANINSRKGKKVPTLLAAHYFLLLEPTTKRSLEALNLVYTAYGKGVTRDPDNPNNINISLSMPKKESQFDTAEFTLSLIAASNISEENKDKSVQELFIDNTNSIFSILGELNEGNSKDIWSTFYVPFFYDLAESEHLESYCNYITQASSEEAKLWVEENTEKINALNNWINPQ